MTSETRPESEILRFPGGATARWYDAESATGPVVVAFPAMGVPGPAYRRLAEALTGRGRTVVVGDYRGQGDSGLRITRATRFGYAALAEDVRVVLQEVRRREPGRPVVLLCHSLAGQVAAALEADRPGAYDALVLAASGTPHWRAFPGRTKAVPLVGTTVAAALSRVTGVLHDNRLGFGRQSARLIEEWNRLALTGSFVRGGLSLPERALPVLALCFAGDTYAPASSTEELVGWFPGARVTRRHLADPAGHVGFLRQPAEVAAAVDEWLAEEWPTR